MTTDYESVRTIAQLLIDNAKKANDGILTSEIILEQVEKALSLIPEGKLNNWKNDLVTELESIFSTWIGEGKTISDKHTPWLDVHRTDISWSYWKRYQLYLKKQGWAQSTLEILHDLTDDTLDRLENPKVDGPWDRRGMIVGHIQSGKTSNYIGLTCKAVDAGFKVVIVLSGMHKSLRSQTQIRFDEGFLGYDSTPSSQERKGMLTTGVGEIDPRLRPDTITNRLDNGDFKKSVADQFNINPGGNPLLFVVKKNASVLRNLLEWIKWATNSITADDRNLVSDVPLLLIDDEADFGSVDTKEIIFNENGKPDEEHNPTRLNELIRKILISFEKRAYVGYTATPFANIFIHDRAETLELGYDLFPRNFITAIPAPSDYIGPIQLFGIEEDPESDSDAIPGLPLIRTVSDYADSLDVDENCGWMPPKHNRLHVPIYEGQESVPPSLLEAIYSFVLVCAVRIARGYAHVHNSMLIHVTRYVDVQDKVYEQVSHEIKTIQNRLQRGDGNYPIKILDELKSLWEIDFMQTTNAVNIPKLEELSWNDIKESLWRAAASIKIKRINGSAGDILDYTYHEKLGQNVIVIGGDKLSRGLTLEGLSVSYFLRASRMYDTLMQMGRWFGYRPGFLDLCRLYTTDDIIDWFGHITVASEELRKEFDHMVSIGGTPKDYGLRVKSHPYLLVTSQVKMRYGTTIELSFSGGISETIVFHKSEDNVENNYSATVNLLKRIESDNIPIESNPERIRPRNITRKWNNCVCWSGVASDHIVRYLNEFKTHPMVRRVNTKLLSEYIEKQNENGALIDWTVLITSGEGSQYNDFPFGKINLVKRNWHPNFNTKEKQNNTNRYVIRRLISPQDETVDFDSSQYESALKQTRKDWTKDPGRSRRTQPPDVPSGPAIRSIRPKTNGLILIYPIDPDGKTEKGESGLPVIGFGISFPRIDNDTKVIYEVNNIYSAQEYNWED